MRKEQYIIADHRQVARDVMRLELRGEDPAAVAGGEFVHIQVPGYYLRRPLSICDRGPGSLVLLYKVVGEGTRSLSQMQAGAALDVLTGLGRGFDASACRRRALLVGGGLGAAPLHLLCRELISLGRQVTAVLGFGSADDVVLEQEMLALGAEVHILTMDGSRGERGLVTDALERIRAQYDFFYTCGPVVMMRRVCGMLDGPGQASLEERMGCGAGICYGCTVTTTFGPRRVCADGPVFNKEDIIW